MEEFNFEPNSHKSKENDVKEKKIDKIVNGKVKKKSEAHKLANIFISEDAGNVGSYIFTEILVPAIKKAISDVFTNGIDMLLYGESRSKKKNQTSVSYKNYYERDNRDERYSERKRPYNYDEIVIDNRGEAEEVLARMDELIDVYGTVSVADFYELVGASGSYTDNKYGWTNIRDARVVRTRDGYIVKLPRAVPLN